MPVIVYKSLKLDLVYAQGRRMLCEYCRQPFTLVWGDNKEFEATGIPLISSDEGMRKNAMKQAVKALEQIAKKPNQGHSKCPHCHCYQSWMVRRSILAGLGLGVAVGLALAGIVAVVGGVWLAWGSGGIFATIAVGAIAGFVVGLRLAVKKGPYPNEKDESALSDADATAFLKQCDEKSLDFVLAWYIALGRKVGQKQALTSLGVYDTTGRRPIFPRELTTTHVLVNLRQE